MESQTALSNLLTHTESTQGRQQKLSGRYLSRCPFAASMSDRRHQALLPGALRQTESPVSLQDTHSPQVPWVTPQATSLCSAGKDQ